MPRIELFETRSTETFAYWESANGKVSVRLVRGLNTLFAKDRWRIEWTDLLGSQHSRTAPNVAKLRSETPFTFRLRARQPKGTQS